MQPGDPTLVPTLVIDRGDRLRHVLDPRRNRTKVPANDPGTAPYRSDPEVELDLFVREEIWLERDGRPLVAVSVAAVALALIGVWLAWRIPG